MRIVPDLLLPRPMVRLTWFAPLTRLGQAMEQLAATRAFHLHEHVLLGTPADIAALCRVWEERDRVERHHRAYRLQTILPRETFLHYRFGWLPPEQRAVYAHTLEVLIEEEGLFLWVATSPPSPALAPYLFPETPPPEVPALPIEMSDATWHMLGALKDRLAQAGPWVVIDGWVCADDQPRFEHLLTSEIRFFTPAEHAGLAPQEVPVLLRKPPWLEGFSALVRTYGTTGYREIDPTLFFAFSFVLMFGMMFADLGQGLLLTGLGAYLLRGSKWPNAKAVGTVLLPIGLSAALFGALFGSVFAREDVLPALWFHPLEQASFYLAGSIALGICTNAFGLLLSLVNAVRLGRWRKALGDTFGPLGFVYYSGCNLLLFALVTDQDFLLPIGFALAGGALVVFIGLGYWTRRRETPMIRLVLPFLEGYDMVTKLLVQTLSFARVPAFTLAHIGLSQALVMTCKLLDDWPPLSSLVFIGGNLCIVALEGVLVSIQVLRLNFFEFFTKFVIAEGKRFTPWVLREGVYA